MDKHKGEGKNIDSGRDKAENHNNGASGANKFNLRGNRIGKIKFKSQRSKSTDIKFSVRVRSLWKVNKVKTEIL